MELIATWWAAVLAALICAVPAGLFFVVYLLAPIEELPAGGHQLEEFGKIAVPIAAPLTAALLVGPGADLGTVLLVAAGVTAGLGTFFVAWEPILSWTGGGRSPLRATVATVVALAVSLGITLLLTSVPLAWIALLPAVVFAVLVMPASKPSGRYWLRSIQVDGRTVDCRWIELNLSPDGSWLLVWTGPAREQVAGHVAFRAEHGDSTFAGRGTLAALGVDDVPGWWAPPPRRTGGKEPQPETGWTISGRARDLRFDGHRVRVTS